MILVIISTNLLFILLKEITQLLAIIANYFLLFAAITLKIIFPIMFVRLFAFLEIRWLLLSQSSVYFIREIKWN